MVLVAAQLSVHAPAAAAPVMLRSGISVDAAMRARIIASYGRSVDG